MARTLLLVASFSLATLSLAQVSPVYVLFDALPVSQDGALQLAEFSPEYLVVASADDKVSFSAFGFYERRVNAGYSYFTNHSQGISVPSWGLLGNVSLKTEFGAGDGDTFGQTGIQLNLSSLPIVSSLFGHFSVTEYIPLWGKTFDQETVLVWYSKRLGPLSFEGFYRTLRTNQGKRVGGYGQPQLHFHLNESVSFMLEVETWSLETSDRGANALFGIRWKRSF